MTNWNGWKITDEQADKIRNGEQAARDTFYFDNLDRIRAMAFNYAKRNPHCNGLADDMAQNVYLDLLYFKQENGVSVTDGKTLSRFIYSSFRFTPHGGLLYLSKNNPKLLAGGGLKTYAPDFLSLDKPFGRCNNAERHQDDNNARTLADIIPAPDTLGAVDYTDDLKEVCAAYLSPRLREYLGYFMDGFAPSVIGQKMGCKGDNYGAYKSRMCENLRKHAAEILPRLDALGVNVDYYAKAPQNPDTPAA